MSTATVTPDGTIAPREFPTPPFGRLVLVELRKMVNTRSGRWLLLAVVGIALVVAVVRGLTGPAEDRTMVQAFQLALLPVGILLPVIGILTATSEWSQRTALTTFALVPRRSRIGVAKIVAALLLGTAAVAVCLLMGAVGNLVATTVGGVDGSWSISGAELSQALLAALLGMLMGLGFGLLLMSPALAIVAYFALPTVFTLAGGLISGLAGTWPWINATEAQEPLFDGSAHGADWGRILVSGVIWIGIPIVLGLVRMHRHEVK